MSDESPKEDQNLTPNPNLTSKDTPKQLKVMDYLTGDGFPEDTPKKIKKSPNKGFYYDSIRAGWSLRQLQRYALNHFGEEISTDTFRRFKELLPPDQIMPPTYFEERLKGIDAKIDPMQELQNMIQVQKGRVAMALKYEDRMSGNKDVLLPMFMKTAREEIELLLLLIEKLANLQIACGLINMRTAENLPRYSGVSVVEAEVRDIINELDTENQQKVLTIIAEIDRDRNRKDGNEATIDTD